MLTDSCSMDQPEVLGCICGLFTHVMRWSRQLAPGLWHMAALSFNINMVTMQSQTIRDPAPEIFLDYIHKAGDMNPL